MKKLFTLIAFLTCFLGAKAELVEVYSIDYSTYNGFPFYVMGYVPEWFDGVMTDFGAMYTYKTEADVTAEDNVVGEVQTNNAGATYKKIELAEPGWHQYFIADGIPTTMDGKYKVVAIAKASEATTVSVNMGWGWDDGQQAKSSVNIGTDWGEVEWEYSGIAGSSCNLVAQPGTFAGTIEWKSLKVYEDKKQERPTLWQEWLTDDGKSIIPNVEHTNKYVGDAETAWPAWSLEVTDGVNINWRTDRAPEICAWALTMGKNNDNGPRDGVELDGRARPFPADIEAEEGNASNHVYAVHVDQIAVIDDDASIQWSNQFWLQAPKSFKANETVKIKFRYKAQKGCSVATQWHKKNPSDYLNYTGVGSVAFTTEWQEFSKDVTLDTDGTYSLAFNLTSDSKKDAPQEPNIFYFDDLCWQTMVLDEGLFVAGTNTVTGMPEYDFDNAIQFVESTDEAGCLEATIGKVGDKTTYVNEIMISTVRGNTASFKSATIKPAGDFIGEDNWGNYTESSLAKINLKAVGAWKIYVDTEQKQVNILMLDGEEVVAKDVVTNTTNVIVHGLERDDLSDTAQGDNPQREEEGGTGETWDNQFFLVANRVLEAGEETVVKFQYKANKAAKTTTQTHAQPGGYIHWAAIGDVNFTEEWQEFSYDYTIPNEAAGKSAQSIAFNMAEIKEACDYELKDFQWYLKYEEAGKTMENLINAEGTANFFVKEGAGTNPHEFVPGGTGIENVAAKTVKTSAVIYNIAGQRVNKNYKGLVVKDGKKVVLK